MNGAGHPTPAGKTFWTHQMVDGLLATRHVRELGEAGVRGSGG
ncbi:hypothetical protein ACIBL3_23615 [Kribbella sp. NPDC050124]